MNIWEFLYQASPLQWLGFFLIVYLVGDCSIRITSIIGHSFIEVNKRKANFKKTENK